MNFFEPTEFLLLMNHNKFRCDPTGNDPYPVLSMGDRKRLYDAGIRTSHEQPAWWTIEPSRGEYDFSYLDGIINLNREAGLKSLLQISGWANPRWMPEEWFAETESGHLEPSCLSMWNEEAQQYSDKYYHNMVTHYAGNEDVAWFFGEFQGGEGVYVNSWCLFDAWALEDYQNNFGAHAKPVPESPETMQWFGDKVIHHLLRKADILYPQWHEIWNCQQYLMDTWSKAFGNFRHADTMKAFRDNYPDASIVLLQYTYFDSSHDANNVRHVDHLREVSNCEVIAEAMFCDGLRETTPKSIEKGFRGQIIYPNRHGFDGEGVDDYIVSKIKNSHETWLKAYENKR